MALVISRRESEAFYIGETKVIIARISGNKATIAIEAKPEINIRRAELKAIPMPKNHIIGICKVCGQIHAGDLHDTPENREAMAQGGLLIVQAVPHGTQIEIKGLTDQCRRFVNENISLSSEG